MRALPRSTRWMLLLAILGVGDLTIGCTEKNLQQCEYCGGGECAAGLRCKVDPVTDKSYCVGAQSDICRDNCDPCDNSAQCNAAPSLTCASFQDGRDRCASASTKSCVGSSAPERTEIKSDSPSEVSANAVTDHNTP